jgi:cytochrome P450
MQNPIAYEKLIVEVDTVVANGTLFILVAYAKAVKLPYLKACIDEGMRLHSSVGLTMPRLVPIGEATIFGFHFPKDYCVGVNGVVVQYDKDVFGSNANNFNLDRWIEGDVVRMNKTMI